MSLTEQDRTSFRATVAFLSGRLEERATVDWALRLKSNDTIQRLALLELIDSPSGREIREPWRSAWRLIEEGWNNPAVEDHPSTSVYDAQHRLSTGDRSGSLVAAIVELVQPRLKVEPFSDMHLHYREPPKRPRKVEDLFSTGLTSGRTVDPDLLGLGSLTDSSFLVSLAFALDAAVTEGLNIGRRIGWDGERHLWQLGVLHRVNYVPAIERADGENEPDEFNQGIAPAVKLLHAVVSRLVDIGHPVGTEFVHRWRLTNSPIHLRLWAAMSWAPKVTPAGEVGSLLLSLDDWHFWDLHDYPEVTELRAKRFGELDPNQQSTITARIRKRPPRNMWPRKSDKDHVQNARLYWAVRELRRIEIAGAPLPKPDKDWLDVRLRKFPDLAIMDRLDEGFLNGPQARWVPQTPDSRYDSLAGAERLKVLEAALSSTRSGWDDDPAKGAADWIRQPGNPLRILVDFESTLDGGAAFANVWDRFGWAHSTASDGGKERNPTVEASRVLLLLIKLPEETVRHAIAGISHWLSAWEKQVVVLPEGLSVWLKVWPIALEVTNAKQRAEEEIHLDTVAQSPDDSDSRDLDTLNTPAGKLIGVFLAGCPNLNENDRPFSIESGPGRMRDAVIAAPGRSGLIARHRMIELLPYFLAADPAWTNKYLITPLIADNSEAMTLWRAIAHRTHFTDVLKTIGRPMAERATDRRLGRETRNSFVFSLVIECLHALREQREPAVPYTRIQQMIRSLDDEVRAYGAAAVGRFVSAVLAPRDREQSPPSAENLFQSAAKPFLERVWPQERSLSTPGVSRALADLPAAAREAFAEAVAAVERFLVPFDCWSMIDYGLYGEENGKPKLSSIDNHAKAAAFLRLLDLTVGTAEGSVIPHDLANALDQVHRVAPNLAQSQVFRRLATAARRA